MQITNSVVCDTSKGSLYKQIKPPLVGEHAFPLTRFVLRVTRLTLHLVAAEGKCQQPGRNCRTHVISRPILRSRFLGGGRYAVTDINIYAITNSVVCDTSKGSLYKLSG